MLNVEIVDWSGLILKITMFSDMDSGFLAQTLKPAFEKLGHECVIMQTLKTYLDPEGSHIDYLLGKMNDEEILALKDEFIDTDFFIIRTVTDFTLKYTNILPYLNKHNMIYKIHGSELREKNVPYSLRTWMIDWCGREPWIAGPRDPSLLDKYKGRVITTIERPIDIDKIFGNSQLTKTEKDIDVDKVLSFTAHGQLSSGGKNIYALTTPTNIQKKGTDELMEAWKSRKIPLQVVSGVSREEVLQYKGKASYYIDRIGSYKHGPYGMNSVEAWLLRVPVFSEYGPGDLLVCPELEYLVNKVDISNVEKTIKKYKRDETNIEKAYQYAIETHNSIKIARQYIELYKWINE